MVLNNIEQLLERYDLGETTLAEEQQLRQYFLNNPVPEHLESYRLMFGYFEEAKTEQYNKEVSIKPKKNNVYKWISVAAVAVFVFGIYISQPKAPKTELSSLSPEEQELYYKTVEALQLMSTQLNKGTQKLTVLNTMSKSYTQGVSKIGLIDEFSNTTNKIFKTTN